MHVFLYVKTIKRTIHKQNLAHVLQDMVESMGNVCPARRIATPKVTKHVILLLISAHAETTMSKLEKYVYHAHKLT